MLHRIPAPAEHDISLSATLSAILAPAFAISVFQTAGYDRAALIMHAIGATIALTLVSWHVAWYRYRTVNGGLEPKK